MSIKEKNLGANTMNKLIGGCICVAGALLAFGIDLSTIISDVSALILLGGVVHYLFLRKLPENFWPMLFGVFFGPIILASLLRAICSAIWNSLVSTFGVLAPAPLILGGLAISFLAFLYVRSRIKPLLKSHGNQPLISERRPVLPSLRDGGELVCIEEESDSHNEYSDED